MEEFKKYFLDHFSFLGQKCVRIEEFPKKILWHIYIW